jgi:hypothetical protein
LFISKLTRRVAVNTAASVEARKFDGMFRVGHRNELEILMEKLVLPSQKG